MHNALKNNNIIQIFDRDLHQTRIERTRSTFTEYNFLFNWAERHLADRLHDTTHDFPLAVQIGTRASGTYFEDTNKIKSLYRIGLDNEHIHADAEFLPIKEASSDLITSILDLHSINDLPGCLLQIRKALKPDGLFLAAMLGGETLYELRESLTQTELSLKDGISPRVAPFADKQQMGALLQRAGFALPVVDSEIITVTYENIFKLMHDLRGMAENNIIAERSRKNPGKAFFFKAAQYYAEHFSEPDGRIKASFEVIFLSGWSPHESQQKPLKPGSAQHSLAEALGTNEIKTGETP